jgi:hypothetical protein
MKPGNSCKTALYFIITVLVSVIAGMAFTVHALAKPCAINTYTEAGNISESRPLTPVLTAPAYGSRVSVLPPRLQWNASEDAATYTVQVAADSGFSTPAFDQADIITPYYDVPGLKWNSNYYWRVSAQDSMGVSSAWSSHSYFKTAPGPLPNRPENLTATAVSSSQINLSWQDKSDNEIRFNIERKTTGSAYVLITTRSSNVTSYADTNLQPDTVYSYRVSAHGTIGDSLYSDEASTTTIPLPPQVPSLSSPFRASFVSTLTPRLQWTASQALDTYSVQVAADYDFSTIIINQTDVPDPYYQVPYGVFNWESPYFWRVSAKSPTGISSGWSPSAYFMVFQNAHSSFACGCGH